MVVDVWFWFKSVVFEERILFMISEEAELDLVWFTSKEVEFDLGELFPS